MVEQFFDELRRGGGALEEEEKANEPHERREKSHGESEREESFLAVILTIRQIVWRKLFRTRQEDSAPDSIQKVILQLLTWRKNNPKKLEEMSRDEWQSFAAKAAHHEVNRRISSDDNLSVSLDEAGEIADCLSIAGNTKAEVASLASGFWQGICQLSLRQRRALLLGSETLIVILRQNGIGNREISDLLELDDEKLAELIDRLPLKNFEIAQLIAAGSEKSGKAKNRNINSLTNSVKKARHEARARLQKILSK